jgi:hypothetical protein
LREGERTDAEKVKITQSILQIITGSKEKASCSEREEFNTVNYNEI